MTTKIKWLGILITCCLLLGASFHTVFADHDSHDDDASSDSDSNDGKSKEYKKHYLGSAKNKTYKQECGACHFVYQPGLLPAGSWGKILEKLPSHFGEDVSPDQESMKIIGEYLQSNAADYSSAKRSKKILRSLGGQTPLRITDIPYIRNKHRKLTPNIFKKKSIGSFSNCPACHTTADQGVYEDDNVKIPRDVIK